MSDEIWKPVKGYEGICEVSNTGEVRSLDRVVPHSYSGILTIPGRLRKKGINGNGYYHVGLSKNGQTISKRVHRMVAEAFIPNPDSLPEVNHIDGNKLNNHVDNLEWVTKRQNSIHAHELGLIDHARGVTQAKAKLTDEYVVEMRKLREQGMQYKDIAKMYGVNTHSCRWACTGLTWAHVDYPPAPYRTNRKHTRI